MSELLENVVRNRAHWDDLARQYVEAGERAWAQEKPTWGIWQVPETEVRVFSEELAGKDVIELGCGTAYISAWLSRRGARVVGLRGSAWHGTPPTAAIRARFSAHPRRR
jgi:2-polyprenyl-3-methyl-5-hydroxy-6-metoxy-1,4-benzoquinol methylase